MLCSYLPKAKIQIAGLFPKPTRTSDHPYFMLIPLTFHRIINYKGWSDIHNTYSEILLPKM